MIFCHGVFKRLPFDVIVPGNDKCGSALLKDENIHWGNSYTGI